MVKSSSSSAHASERAQRPDRLVARTPQSGRSDWEYLDDHLVAVSCRTRKFAASFGAGEVGALVGLWHDLGKLNPEFQQYLWDCSVAESDGRRPPKRRIPHAIWGAAFARTIAISIGGVDLSRVWDGLVLPILGHHTGLPDRGIGNTRVAEFLDSRVSDEHDMKDLVRSLLPRIGGKLPNPRFPALTDWQHELRLRMIFSALVDADSLVSESHREPQSSRMRQESPTLNELWSRFNATPPTFSEQSLAVRQVREEVLAACLVASDEPPGLFRLTVPTGGGKTRSGMAFALKHACLHGLQRVIVALPYTSIIDQTAHEYRAIFGDEAVLEHHSALDVPDSEDADDNAFRQELASENWDVPIIVTTTVQLFESLFSNRRSKTRKLHRLSKCVIILDEVQTLPPELLLPTLDVIHELTVPVEQCGYGSTVILSTATQPAFEVGPLARIVAENEIRAIVPQPEVHFERLRRVQYEYLRKPMTWGEVAAHAATCAQVMIVLNTRPDALALLAEFGRRDDMFHLSTLLCTAHRRRILDEVKERLDAGLPVVLVSTQVVECGINLDFPVVYRAMGPLDRIVQVAGRCNRNGNLSIGRVFVFEPADGRAPRGSYSDGIETARFLLKTRPVDELHTPELYLTYFRRFYAKVDIDKLQIQEYRKVLNYPEVAKRYRLIDQATIPVVVPYEDAEARLAEWRQYPSRKSWRRLQAYVVNLYEYDVQKMGSILVPVSDQLYWCPPDRYDATRHRGIIAGISDPSDFVVGGE